MGSGLLFRKQLGRVHYHFYEFSQLSEDSRAKFTLEHLAKFDRVIRTTIILRLVVTLRSHTSRGCERGALKLHSLCVHVLRILGTYSPLLHTLRTRRSLTY